MSANPFRQPTAYRILEFQISSHEVALLESVFADAATSVSSFEVEGNPQLWRVELLFSEELPEADIRRRLGVLKEEHGIRLAMPVEKHVAARDWVRETAQAFPPLQVGRYFAYGSHYRKPPPYGTISMLINAGAAFGSGEHATTSGCLLAFDRLGKRKRFRNMLDMGCGSAILAIALAKQFRKPVLAVDIDPVSVRVAQENIRLNREHKWIRACAGNGFLTPAARHQAPYDLIAANILARPLMRMATQMQKALVPGGFVVLSGLLDWQENMVRSAYHMQGLRLVSRIRKNGWHTLVMHKKAIAGCRPERQ